MSSFIVERSVTPCLLHLAPKHSCCMYFTGNVWCNLIRWQSEETLNQIQLLPRNSVTRSLMIMTACRIGERYYLWIPNQAISAYESILYGSPVYKLFDYLFHFALHRLPAPASEAGMKLAPQTNWNQQLAFQFACFHVLWRPQPCLLGPQASGIASDLIFY